MDFNDLITGAWILICGILVFFMQTGFSLLETGFCRSKNAGNILMKNLLAFTIACISFSMIGYSMIYNQSFENLIGIPTLFLPENQHEGSIFFQMLFVATASTIVSGAVAERIKFEAFILFCFGMSILIYPIAAHWVRNSQGWLRQFGFVDFAGGTTVHLVGGCAAFVGSKIIGPRIGKYKAGISQAIPGHNLLLGTIGVFILWFGWFGFNGGSIINDGNLLDPQKLSTILVNTNLAACAGTLTALLFTWLKFGFPDISMTLNGALAGLVVITAGCDAVTPGSAIIMGIIAGIVVVYAIIFIEEKLKIDDPTGAIAVHGVCGALGTILIGVFSLKNGLMITGNWQQLNIQFIGILAIIIWATSTSFLIFYAIQKFTKLRVTEKEEIEGLDKTEHGIGVYNS